MTITLRQYRHPEDFGLVSEFLTANYQPFNADGNWLQPTWEYMHSHPSLDPNTLDKIGIWEEKSDIVAVVHHESRLGEAFFEVRPGFEGLKPQMLAYAEGQLFLDAGEGNRLLRAYVNDFDKVFEATVGDSGYRLADEHIRPLYLMKIPKPFPEVETASGYKVKSLADENDLRKINRVLWRGFNHPGEPPDEEIPGRKKMQSTPNFRKELTIVVEAPSGDFASFAGTWFEPTNRFAYVEPVATDPDYRRMGLGRAAVLEGIRRCGALGAAVAYVGSNLPFYQSMGFEKCYVSRCWEKRF